MSVEVSAGSPRIWDGESRGFNTPLLREAMLARDISVEAIAERAGVSQATVYHALQGRPTRLRTARRLLEALLASPPTLDLGAATVVGSAKAAQRATRSTATRSSARSSDPA